MGACCPYQSFAVRFSWLGSFKGFWQGKMFEKDTPHYSSPSAESCLPPHWQTESLGISAWKDVLHVKTGDTPNSWWEINCLLVHNRNLLYLTSQPKSSNNSSFTFFHWPSRKIFCLYHFPFHLLLNNHSCV